MTILATTRAMRHLAPEPVPAELIRTVIEAATWAPSAGNWQTAQFVVVTDRDTMARLAVLWSRAIDDYRTLMGAANLRISGEPVQDRIAASIDYQRDHFADTPVVPIGWPVRRFGPVGRRPVDEVIHRERW
jgi:nitroreductase